MDGEDVGADTGCGEWLTSLGLGRFTPAFIREELTWRDVPSLTDEDLRDVIGIDRAEERARFLAAATTAAASTASDLELGVGWRNQTREGYDNQRQPRKKRKSAPRRTGIATAASSPGGGGGGGSGGGGGDVVGDGSGFDRGRSVAGSASLSDAEEEWLMRGNMLSLIHI